MSPLTEAGTCRKYVLPKLYVHLPVPDKQRRIVGYLDHLQARLDSLKKLQDETAKELDALTASILSKAFSGEL